MSTANHWPYDSNSFAFVVIRIEELFQTIDSTSHGDLYGAQVNADRVRCREGRTDAVCKVSAALFRPEEPALVAGAACIAC